MLSLQQKRGKNIFMFRRMQVMILLKCLACMMKDLDYKTLLSDY
jgi:hypothetical protein